MTDDPDDPVDLDEHRGMAAQKATEIRRQSLREFQADQAALLRRQEELEKLLLAAPAETWPEAAAKKKLPGAKDPGGQLSVVARARNCLYRTHFRWIGKAA
jgi:hypothetical protein